MNLPRTYHGPLTDFNLGYQAKDGNFARPYQSNQKMQRPNNLNNTAVLLPEPSLRRLPWYLSYVSGLRRQGITHVSTTQMGAALNLDASKIAKDLSLLDLRGKTRIGYEVPLLEEALQKLLGFQESHNAVMIGVGSLGSSLIGDRGLGHYGLNIVAGFDVRPEVIGTEIFGVPVYDMESLIKERERLQAEIGVLAVPPEVAQSTASLLVASGIRAIWNFTPTRILVPEDVVITNTSIYSHLALMYNRLANLGSDIDR